MAEFIGTKFEVASGVSCHGIIPFERKLLQCARGNGGLAAGPPPLAKLHPDHATRCVMICQGRAVRRIRISYTGWTFWFVYTLRLIMRLSQSVGPDILRLTKCSSPWSSGHPFFAMHIVHQMPVIRYSCSRFDLGSAHIKIRLVSSDLLTMSKPSNQEPTSSFKDDLDDATAAASAVGLTRFKTR